MPTTSPLTCFSLPSQSSSSSELPTPVKNYQRGGQGCGYVPAALLRSCSQVYEEARMLSWEVNEYVFINWFASGVYASRAFLRALKPWQRKAMRYARVEVLGRDLKDSWVANMVGGRAGGGEWIDLCSLWSGGEFGDGLRGLRLGIKGHVGHSMPGTQPIQDGPATVGDIIVTHGQNDANTITGQSSKTCITPKDRNILDIEAEWVTSGIKQMKNLRWLELEIEDDGITRDIKVQFCLDLGAALSSVGRKVDVTYVEKITIENKVEEPERVDRDYMNFLWGEQ